MTKPIIGLVGRMSSGKGTAAEYLKSKYQAEVFTYSQPLRDVLNRLSLPVDRDHLIKMSETLRDKFGDDLFARLMVQSALASSAPVVVVDGIRRPADIVGLPEIGLILVEIQAEAETRWRRLTERREKADDSTKTLAEFLEDEKRSTEQTIDAVVAEATEHIDNNGTLDDLYRQLDDLISRLKI